VRVYVRASSHQTLHDRRTVGKMRRPVGCRMQQSAMAVPVTNTCRRQPRVSAEHALECIKIASLDRPRCCDSTRIVRGYEVNCPVLV
jgi:hypothetical protein